MDLSSTAFSNKGTIPSKYTCDSQNISPDLSWQNAPQNTQSFALICDDPDAPIGTWTHWVLYNIPSNTKTLPENVQTLPQGTQIGINSWNKNQYGGPCPPSGEHRYFFKLYALDTILDTPNMTSNELQHAIKGHVLDETTFMGKYRRQ